MNDDDLDAMLRARVARRVDIELNRIIDRELRDMLATMFGSDEEAAEYRVARLNSLAEYRAEAIDAVTALLSRRVMN